MRDKSVISFLIFSILTVFSLSAQTASNNQQQEERKNPIELIEQRSEGRIHIDIPENILEMIMSSPKQVSKPNLRPGINHITGWRIQVFNDGRNQHSLEARANARGNAVLARFPKYRGQIYTFSKSPNWYTRVGNFTTIQEANSALAELKQAFPSFASEMRTVQCRIIVVK